jgi:hypothetical protein
VTGTSEWGIPKGGERVDMPLVDMVEAYGRCGFGKGWERLGTDHWCAVVPTGYVFLSKFPDGYHLEVVVDRKVALTLHGYGSLDLPFTEAYGIADAPPVLSTCGYDPDDFADARDWLGVGRA